MSYKVKTRAEVITQCKITHDDMNRYYDNMGANQQDTLLLVWENNLMINKSLGGKEVIVVYRNGKQYTTNKNRTKEYCFDDSGWELHPWNACMLAEPYVRLFKKMKVLNPSKKAILAGFKD